MPPGSALWNVMRFLTTPRLTHQSSLAPIPHPRFSLHSSKVMFGDYDDRRHRDKQYIRRNIMFPQQDEEAVRVIVNKHKNHW